MLYACLCRECMLYTYYTLYMHVLSVYMYCMLSVDVCLLFYLFLMFYQENNEILL